MALSAFSVQDYTCDGPHICFYIGPRNNLHKPCSAPEVIQRWRSL